MTALNYAQLLSEIAGGLMVLTLIVKVFDYLWSWLKEDLKRLMNGCR